MGNNVQNIANKLLNALLEL